jgi:hypothetical protein
LAPESILVFSDGSRRKFNITRTRIAAASATATDHTPPTAASVVEPQRSCARKLASMRGSTITDMKRFTSTTTSSGKAAIMIGGLSMAGVR